MQAVRIDQPYVEGLKGKKFKAFPAKLISLQLKRLYGPKSILKFRFIRGT